MWNNCFDSNRSKNWQKGVIVELNGLYADSVLYSPISGKALLSPSLVTRPMKLGSFLTYNVHRHHEQKVWIATDVRYLGEELEIVPYLMRKTKLQLRLFAMVNRMDKKTSSAWLWNDSIGRIRIPPLYFLRSITPFDIVELIVMYDGEHEDVPWQAVNATHIRDAGRVEEKRKQVAKLLSTSDGWTVTKVVKHDNDTNGFYTMLSQESNSGRMTTAFAAWTDYWRGENPPSIGTECRVTLFQQDRIDKLNVRAVLVSPMRTVTSRHLTNHLLPNLHSPPLPIQPIPLITSSRVRQIPVKYNSSRCTSESMMSNSPTQSEIELMIDNSRIDDFRPRLNSAASTTSSLSSSPLINYMPIFFGGQFEPWHPTEEEKAAYHNLH